MIIIVTGKSGTGKTTLRKELMALDGSLSKSLAYTTRAPRPEEKDGIDYHFVSKEEFLANQDIILKRQDGENLYGVNKFSLRHKNIISILDLNGIQEIASFLPRAEIRIILLEAPTKTIVSRLQERGTSLPEIAQRLRTDRHLNKKEIRERFPNISLKVIDNSQPLSKTISESMVFLKGALGKGRGFTIPNFYER